MKVVILAGGLGTRLSEETDLRPKPMIEIGGKPILWHIMKIYSHYGFNDFIICCGYKGYMIKEYFANYFLHQSDVTIDTANNKIAVLNNNVESWTITLLDTGLNSMTGGRILRAKKYLNNEPFFLTYGDGLSDINIPDLLSFHHSHKGYVTMTSVQPEGRFGALTLGDNNRVVKFLEKPSGEGSWINGGFFVCDAEVLDFIKEDSTIFEREPLENLAGEGKLFTFKHDGFWKSMDTLRDKTQLEEMIVKNHAPWIKW
jgi:glucose-1-phosphate cytidylyltransferase